MRKLFTHIIFVISMFLLNITFIQASVKSTFTYANNTNFAGQEEAIKADLYKPNLFSTQRPVLIVYHGGGYAAGDKNLAALKIFADYFTSKNISVILPDFRQGWYESTSKPLCESVTPEYFEDAAHRAYQDNRALIRFCKANANTLGIDSNKIFLMGISSGGFLVLHHLYMQDVLITQERLSRLGSLDLQGNAYRNSTEIAGIISIVGGFYKNDVNIVHPYPTLLFNNSCDGAVDFFNGWLGNCSNTIRSYGPGIFTPILEQQNVPYQFHVFCGYNHGFNSLSAPLGGDADAINYINNKSFDFINNITNGAIETNTSIASDSINARPINECRNFETFYWCKIDSIAVGADFISITPNPISCQIAPKLNIRHEKDELLTIEIIDISGRLISSKQINYNKSNEIIYLQNRDFVLGVNIVLIKDAAKKVLYKTKVMRYCEY